MQSAEHQGRDARQGPPERQGPQEPQRAAALAGFTVAVTAARRAEEFGALLRRRGAEVVYAPAMRTVPLADDGELRAATGEIVERPPDTVVVTTAVGFRGWLEAAEGWALGDALRERMADAELLARGPKVCGALRAEGLREGWSPGSESTAEVRDRLLSYAGGAGGGAEGGLAGRRIAVQLHGEPLTDVVDSLRAAGAEVVPVPVYRWLPPEDLAPLDRLIDATLAHRVDAVTFTSAPAATCLLERSERRGVRDALLDALRDKVAAACVGPVTAAPLERHDVPTVQPERFRLGPLVHALCGELTARAPVLSLAGRRIEIRGHAAVVEDEPRALAVAEAAVLRALARRPRRPVSRAELVRELGALSVAGDLDADESGVEAAVAGLRRVLPEPGLLESVDAGGAVGTGEPGYRLAADPGPNPPAEPAG